MFFYRFGDVFFKQANPKRRVPPYLRASEWSDADVPILKFNIDNQETMFDLAAQIMMSKLSLMDITVVSLRFVTGKSTNKVGVVHTKQD